MILYCQLALKEITKHNEDCFDSITSNELNAVSVAKSDRLVSQRIKRGLPSGGTDLEPYV